ncbi:hypothetical protein CFE70_000732 [Pyrenophora teres f. teres 0-1]|nr:hypothetical protein P3342_000900 [Pyrenophora teres f. teres]
MALVTQNEFDVLFGTMYALCCAIEMSMVASHLVWLLRTRGMRRRAKEAGKTFDEFQETTEWQARGINIEKKLMKAFFKKNTEEEKEQVDTNGSEILVHSEEATPKLVSNTVV